MWKMHGRGKTCMSYYQKLDYTRCSLLTFSTLLHKGKSKVRWAVNFYLLKWFPYWMLFTVKMVWGTLTFLYFWHRPVCFKVVFLLQVINAYLTLLVRIFNKENADRAFAVDTFEMTSIWERKKTYKYIISVWFVALLSYRLTRGCTNTLWGSSMKVNIGCWW